MEPVLKNHNLAKIPTQAFAVLDEHQHRLKKGGARHHQNNRNGREVLDCFEAAKKFGGVLIIEHQVVKKKPAPPQLVIRKHF